MRLVYCSVLLATIASTALAPTARAQVDSREGIALQNEIYQLRNQVQQLQNQGGQSYQQAPRYNGGSGDLVTQLLTRVDTLEDQVRQLRGQVEQLQNQQQQQSLDLNKKVDDLKFQLGQGAGATQTPGAPQPAAPQPQYQQQPGYQQPPQYQQQTSPPPGNLSLTPSPPPPQPAPRPNVPRTPEISMQDGNAALARRDYPAAEAAAREVLANRTSPRAYDAKLLLAQALEGQRQYPQAAVAFDDAYNWSRKGSHAQEALIGLASSLTAIKENKAACDTISRMKSDFPTIRPDLRSAVAATAQKAGCH